MGDEAPGVSLIDAEAQAGITAYIAAAKEYQAQKAAAGYAAITGPKERVFLVHGEKEQSHALCETLRERHDGQISVPAWKSTVEI